MYYRWQNGFRTYDPDKKKKGVKLQMREKKCPNCGLINPGSGSRCDCGYDFETGIIEKSYSSETEPRKRGILQLFATTRFRFTAATILVLAIALVWVNTRRASRIDKLIMKQRPTFRMLNSSPVEHLGRKLVLYGYAQLTNYYNWGICVC